MGERGKALGNDDITLLILRRMTMQPPAAGFNLVAAYQTSGIPWVTSSIVTGVVHYELNYVSKTVTVKHVAGTSPIRVAFTQNGLNTSRYVELIPGENMSEELRATDIWISGSGNSVSVIAGLTTVQSNMLGFRMTGSLSPLFEGMG